VAGQQVYSNLPQQSRLSKLTTLAKSLAAPAAPVDIHLSSSATINAQFWLNQFPWRPTAGWAVVSALLSSGLFARPLFLDWREIALLLLLVDPLWGSVWRLAAGRSELLPLRRRDVTRQVWLPYLQAGSPAARLLGWDGTGVLPLVFRVVFPTILLAFAIAFVLGGTAVWMTVVVVLASVLGWIGRHTIQNPPAILHSLVTIALPWGLALSKLGLTPEAEFWRNYVALAVLWFMHNWGEGRSLRHTGDWPGIVLLAVADLALAVLLIVSRAPLWLALMSILWLPTWFFVYQRRPMQRLNFWWLMTMLLSGVALGQSL
jgi:hypothetical protein